MKRRIALLLVPAFAGFGCLSIGDPSGPTCPEGATCDSSSIAGPVYGLRADGTPDLTVQQAWPNRPAEPDPLDAKELATACAAIASCIDATQLSTQEGIDTRHLYQALCLEVSSSYFWEERAVPTSDKNERWTFEAHEILKATSCAEVLGAGTPRAPEIVCEEGGCWWSSADLPIPTVSCNGSVATLTTTGKTITRDCARALTTCNETSPTGCDDRAPVACEHPAKDRCDGDIRLGCDGSGKVSFHDCSRIPGGTCGAREDGSLGCIYPTEGCDTLPTCDGSSLSICSLGETVAVDCQSIGVGCADGLCTAP